MTSPTPRPEPVTLAGKIAAAIGYLASALAMFGVITGAEADAVDSTTAKLLVLLAAVPAAVAPVVGAVNARRHVTPLSSPRDDAGNRLVPAGQAGSLFDREADAPGL